MATTGQLVAFTPGGLAEIDTYIDLREKAKVALHDIDGELAKFEQELAKQIAADGAGKPKLEPDAVLAKYKAQQVKTDQLKEKRTALEAAQRSVDARLEELKKSSPAEYVAALDKRIADQRKVSAKTQEEADRAEEALKALTEERDKVAAALPAPSRPPKAQSK